MAKTLVRKPGYMKRAVIAWLIYNIATLATLAALVFIVGDLRSSWFVMVPLMVGVIVSEWMILGETIGPIIKDWIKQEEWTDG